MDVEAGLIGTVLHNGTMDYAMERRITSTFFHDEQHKKVWTYMVKHWTTYGIPPNVNTVSLNYPAYEIEDPQEPIDFFIDQLQDRRKKVVVTEGIKEAAEISAEGGPDAAERMERTLTEHLMQARVETSPVRTVDYLLSLERATADWQAGIDDTGLSYGLPTLDKQTGGLRPEQYVVFTGLAKAKKSWTLLHAASCMQLQTARTVFLTFEMSNREQVERLATLWGKVPYSNVVTKVNLTKQDYDSINRGIAVRRALHPLLGVEDSYGHSTVSSIQALVRSTEADVVCIDGIYLMTDDVTGDPGSSGTQPLTNISRALKRLAKAEGIAVIVTTQTLYGKTKKGQTNLFGMGYTSAFSQDADLVVGIEQNPDNPRWSTMRVLGNRTGPQGGEFNVSWDLDTGLVEEVGINDAADEGLIYGEVDDDGL